ncbi:ankyrin repeat domain-containing protein SOWAHC-like [Babylonia areolata]|uniref:ankyrin repeat domain-containing protein SOWAHC-like n=1 Tax=Babylonia areolata TaxID=304850 RepID=UPI003FD5CE6C
MASDFSIDSVKQYMLEKGGRIRNHELVTHFKGYLNHPVHKAENREKFKDFVNELATIKVEEGEKVLVLKRKHRPDSTFSLGSSSSSSTPSNRSSIASNDQTPFQPPPAKSPYIRSDDGAEVSYCSSVLQECDSPQFKQPLPPRDLTGGEERGPPHADAMRAHSEPPSRGGEAGGPRPMEGEEVDGMMMSKVHSDQSLDVRLKSSTRSNGGPLGVGVGVGGSKQSFEASTASLASSTTGSQGSLSSATTAEVGGGGGSGEEEGNMSVLSIKERVQHLNKMSSESDIQQAKPPPPRKKTLRDDDDESHSSGGTTYITLTPEEKEWMLVSATADYHEMFRLLSRNGQLARVKVRCFLVVFTALHWAAKFGKPEVVKMLANKIGVNVNQRSGYTPLHLAAIHGHEEIIELLVTVYKADANVRDYSGKKAKQYLKNSASSRAQQLLVSTRLGHDFGSASSSASALQDDSMFLRLGTARQSNRARAISSLIQATSSVMRRQPLLRASWEGPHSDDGSGGGGGDGRTPGSTPPGSGPTSPITGRRCYKDEKSLMPPPHIPSHQRRRRGEHSRSSSRESLHSQSRSTGSMDKENNNKNNNNNNTNIANRESVPRSESDPTLSQKTFV